MCCHKLSNRTEDNTRKSPNDPKLSDGGGGKAAAGVRRSAWLGDVDENGEFVMTATVNFPGYGYVYDPTENRWMDEYEAMNNYRSIAGDTRWLLDGAGRPPRSMVVIHPSESELLQKLESPEFFRQWVGRSPHRLKVQSRLDQWIKDGRPYVAWPEHYDWGLMVGSLVPLGVVNKMRAQVMHGAKSPNMK